MEYVYDAYGVRVKFDDGWKYFNNLSIENIYNEDLSNIEMSDLSTLFLSSTGVIPVDFNKYLIKKINQFDKSKNVNAFIYKGQEYWLDKDTRISLTNLANYTNEVTLVLDDVTLKISSEKLKSFLAELELYASKCYVKTAEHLNNAKNLNNDDLLTYDFKTGYPEKISLNG